MRRFVQSLAVLAVTPVALALPVLGRPAPRPHPVAPKVSEHPVAGIDRAAAAHLPGWGAAGPAHAKPLVATPAVTTASFSALGVTWAAGTGDDAEVTARVRQGGRWTEWHALDADADHGPDDSVAADNTPDLRGGTAPWFTGPADAYQLRVAVVAGTPPRDVRVALVDPGTSAADAALDASPTLSRGASAEATIGRPAMVTRAQWGADESLRDGSPDYADTIKSGFVHHTDTSNSYSSAQAASMVRSVYAFHTQSRGWSDIGYNFLVDKYGRVFEGRYGGAHRPVIGAHTGGFNTDTFGVSLLGNYASVAPTAGQLAALEKTFAYKFGLHYVNPLAKTTLTSRGGSKYEEGVKVTFNNVSGHRDAGYTACPGQQTYNRLPTIRTAIKSYMGASLYGPSISTTRPFYLTSPNVTVKAGVPGTQSWRLTVRNTRTGVVVRTINGTAASAISAVWDLKNASNVPVVPDTYTVELSSWTSKTRALAYTRQVSVQSPLPDGVAVRGTDGVVHGIVEEGRLVGVAPAVAAAVRPRSVVGHPGPLAALGTPVAVPRDGMFVKSSSSGATYLVVDGALRPVAASVVTALGLTAPRSLSSAVLGPLPVGPAWTSTTRHPDGQLVKVADGSAWRIEGGARRPFTSPKSLSAWAKSVAVANATKDDLALPLGAPLAPPEGVVLRTANGAAVVSGGTLRPLPDPAALGYTVSTAAVATPEDVAALPSGEPVTGKYRPSGTLLKHGNLYVEVAGPSRRAVPASLVASDPRVPLLARTGEFTALARGRWTLPSGLAGVGSDGVVRVVASGRVVSLTPRTAQALGYVTASLPVLQAADLASLPVGTYEPHGAHPAGTVVTDGTAHWVLDAGTRRPLAASLVPTWRGRPALPATAADLALPVGSPAPPDNGAWLETPSGNRWLVFNGARRQVSSTVARRLGLSASAPVKVLAGDLTASTVARPPLP